MNGMNEFPLLNAEEGIPLFYPHVPKSAAQKVAEVLSGRWIGQGPLVDKLEEEFCSRFQAGSGSALAVGSGTDALHLAYLLADISPGDEVLVPTFTCTATNIPLLYIGATPIFVDVDPGTLNLRIDDIEHRITAKTKALVCVDYGGVPNDYDALRKICDEHRLLLISDGAHALGTRYKGNYVANIADFTTYSFQAIKTITSGDGGMLMMKNQNLLDRAKKLRWFGIDRSAKQKGVWENDIIDVGFKYQMNDIAAAIALEGLYELDWILQKRQELFDEYLRNLSNLEEITIVGSDIDHLSFNSAWLVTIYTEQRLKVMDYLRSHGIESAQVHYRNDRYSIFGGRKSDLPMMDSVENNYLVLPLYPRMSVADVQKVCSILKDAISII